MPLRISKTKGTEGKWEKYQGDIEFKIRPLDADALRDLRKAAATGRMVPDPKTHRMVPDIDDDKFEELLRNYLIEDWQGVVDQDDQPMACTPEGREAVMKVLPIADFIWERAQAPDLLPERKKNSPAP